MKFANKLRRWLPFVLIPVSPRFPPKNITVGDIMFAIVFTASGYFGAIVVKKGGAITFTDFLSWDATALIVSVVSLVISVLFVEIRSVRRSITSALGYTFSGANNEIRKQRKRALEIILMHSSSPCKLLKKFLNAGCYEKFNTDTIEGEMQNTHSMYTVNSYDIISKRKLDEESVRKYLRKQGELVDKGFLIVERLFRIKARDIQSFSKNKKSHALLKELVSTIKEHNKFKVLVHLYTENNPVNTYLDYAIAQQSDRTVVFITDTDELLSHNRYTGIKTSDPMIIEILQRDRYNPPSPAVEKRYNSEEFIEIAEKVIAKA